ncbi:MAG: DUF3307 domain-containing protein [Verrucomicrobiales bacterium]|nr:DUF3307 domain-containing protein [Verrucomicrobiales bacterium]
MEMLAIIETHTPGAMPVHPLALFFAMVIGHALADYPLQGKFLAIKKNRHIKTVDYTGEGPASLWVYCLSAHSLVHAGTVWVILAGFGQPHAVWFAFAEFVLHWIIDFAKCERWTNFHQDQALHMICKGLYLLVLWQLG